MLTDTWTSGGNQFTLTTFRREGESPGEHAERHQGLLAALQELFPPD